MAVTTRTCDHRVYTYVRQCTEKLPVLCAVTNKTSPENIPSTYSVEIPELDFIVNTTKNTVPASDITTFTISVEVPELDSNVKASNNILLITLVITAVQAVVVFIVVIVVCIRRRNSSITRHQQTPVPTNEVTYAQVNKPTKEKTPDHAGEQTRKNPVDDAYDHMEHHRLSQYQIPTESNYDTMQSGGNEELENDYDVTSGTDRPRQIVVDDSSEYSHVQVEHHEIKDPSA
ncbi:uncharacterized protein LOC134683990 [Mytilus trossulus]|uniref:uncharacterized protein LOC134683990 n=1 Tax=Mytilus trossulus TaxID=6551 RepID=UPI003006B5B5